MAQEGLEQLDQVEPKAGEWEAEYRASLGGAGSRSAEPLAGIDAFVALGAEAEFADRA